MKYRLSLVAALTVIHIFPAHAADAPSPDAALAAYQAQDFGKCADTLALLDQKPGGLAHGMDLFYVECLSAAGRTEVALSVLDKQISLGRIDLGELKHKDRPGLNKLRASSGWNSFLIEAEKRDAAHQASIDQPLRQELLARLEKDQAVRQTAIAQGNDAKSWALTEPVDQDNTAWLKKVVAEKGWPTKYSVGQEASKAAFLIVQHATLDPAFQAQVLEHIQVAMEQGQADRSDFALLKDRVLLNQGKPQLYGTQFAREADGTMFMENTQDPAGLDARRQAMDLPPIAEYKKGMAELYHEEVR